MNSSGSNRVGPFQGSWLPKAALLAGMVAGIDVSNPRLAAAQNATPSGQETAAQSDTSVIFVPFPDLGESGGTRAPSISKGVWEKEIASWPDPFTVPHSRSECVKWAYPWPGSKICIGWKVQWQKMYGHLWLIVTLAIPGDIEGAINDALRDATVAATLAGVVTAFVAGGAGAGQAAADTFAASFQADLAARITQKIIKVRAENRTAWGNWE